MGPESTRRSEVRNGNDTVDGLYGKERSGPLLDT